MRGCINCEYEDSLDCHFPNPQKGGPPPFMVQSAQPDRRNGGAACFQFRMCRKTQRAYEASLTPGEANLE